jgi:5-methylcytosine-specific restriction enzyme subunit McrC
MRTITLREYQPSQQSLTRSEVEQLLTVRKVVGLTPLTGEGAYELRAGSTVGTFVLPSLRLLIRPKVGLENLFFLLGFGPKVTRWGDARFPYEQDPDLFKAVAWAFDAEVRRALAQGLVRGYQPRSETLATLRGRIDVAGQLRARQGRPFPLECRFEEYTEDTELNRVIKAAHRRLLQVPQLDAQIARKLRHGFRAFENVASVEYPPGSIPEPVFTRLNIHWRAAERLARLILGQRSLRDQEGAVVGTTFTVDMNALFERFVESIVDEEARRADLRLVPRARRRRQLTKKIPIRPDLILHGGGRDLAVADVKYKELKPAEWPHADLYQLLAYCVSLNLPSGLLIYASDRAHEEHTVEQAGVSMEILGVEMGGHSRDLEARVRRAARHLVRQAAGRRSTQTMAV